MTQDERLQQRFAAQEHELHIHQVELQLQNQELRQINVELEWAHNMYADLFEHAPVGYIVCDELGLIRQVNRAACRNLGTGSSHLVGRHFSLFIASAQRHLLTDLLTETFRNPVDHRPDSVEVQMVRQDGSTWDAQLDCTLLNAPHGLVARTVLTDVTSLKDAHRETERHTAQARQLNDELQTFLHAMTHDLTRPLRQVEGFARLLGANFQGTDEKSARHLRHLLAAAADMGALTSSLTQFFQSTQPGSVHQPLDLNRLVDVIFHELRPQLQGRQVTLTRDQLPAVNVDRQSMHMVFTNLLSNAVKFTRPCPEASIHVGVTTNADGHLFSVTDNGVGFDPQQSGRLFGVFERLHSDRQFEGQGLGLALVRRIVQRCQGRVWAESVPGEGAVFWVQLPALPATE